MPDIARPHSETNRLEKDWGFDVCQKAPGREVLEHRPGKCEKRSFFGTSHDQLSFDTHREAREWLLCSAAVTAVGEQADEGEGG